MAVEKKKIIIVGCGPGAEACITPEARTAVLKADTLIVSRRLKDLFPESTAERIDSGTDVEGTLDAIAAHRDAGLQVILLATGDPGIASLAQPVVQRFGRTSCEIIPGISSIQVAFARLGLGWQDARILSAHKSDPEETAADLREAEKIAVLGGRPGALRWAAGLVRELGGERRVFLCEELTLPGEKIHEVLAGELASISASTRAIILIIQEKLLT